MPRYYFHIRRADGLETDDTGMDLPHNQAAINEARMIASEMLRDAALESRKPDEVLEVLDADGNAVLRFRCSDVETRRSK
jgi:hypothetical protein